MLNRISAIIVLILLFPIISFLSILIFLTDGRPVFYFYKRVGYNNSYFNLLKFRTMKNGTPDVATHLISNPEDHYIKFGRFLRKFSLDEIPQLINIVSGEMVFIGPRPALYNQHDLISLRTMHDIHLLVPGITGWAQINGRDELSIEEKVKADFYYKENNSMKLNFKILFLTFLSTIAQKNVNH